MNAERRHRRVNDACPYPVDVRTGVLLILLSDVVEGSRLKSEPTARRILFMQPSRQVFYVLGYVLRDRLPEKWLLEAGSLDYADVMNSKQV